MSLPSHALLATSLTQPPELVSPLVTCYKTSEDFRLLVENIHCHVSGGLEVQWVALKQKHEREST